MNVFRKVGIAVLLSSLSAGIAYAQSWRALKNNPPNGVGAILQLRDGTIIAHNDNAPDWYKLTPDATGSYINGTWKQIANMPAGYSPLYYGSAVLSDNRVIVEGGEYNGGNNGVWTNLGAIYDPKTDTWTSVNPPAGWSSIGDAQGVILDNGTYMQANCCSGQVALFNPTNLTWTATGPSHYNDEEGWTRLYNGKILTVDAWNACGSNMGTEVYDPTAGTWTCGAKTPSQLWDSGGHELGAAVLMYNNQVIQFGAVPATAVYDVASDTWAAGPTPPGGLDQADGPSALEPNGKVLAMLSPGEFNPGCQFMEYDPVAKTLTNAPNPPQCPADTSFVGHLMVLPTGQIMYTDFNNVVEVYTPAPGVVAAAKPQIIAHGNTYIKGSKNNLLYGKNLNGLTQNNAYGDDYQTATNYPLVQLTDTNTGNVWWATTHDESTHSIAPNTLMYTKFDLNPNMPGGVFSMVVIANGIASDPLRINVISNGTK